MEQRKLGRQGLTVSAVGLGCMGMSEFYVGADEQESIGIGFVAYSPLGRGFLTGRFRSIEDLPPNDFRRNAPRFQGENFEKNLAVVDRIHELAREKGVNPSQLALAWVLAQGKDVVPIPGTTTRKHLEENATAASIHLTKENLARIEQVSPRGFAAGDRYPPQGMATVNR